MEGEIWKVFTCYYKHEFLKEDGDEFLQFNRILISFIFPNLSLQTKNAQDIQMTRPIASE